MPQTTHQPHTTTERLHAEAGQPQHILCCSYLHHGIARAFCGHQLAPQDLIVPAEMLPPDAKVCPHCQARSLIDAEPVGAVACRACPVDWLGLT